ncbi:hypothetical protein EK21DRAFT_69219 [Setomelanomma holmii]|uniref:DUF6594 domain-containing protein n=1 Tax=Setomelanomma holmii TaxID=210430 RepID=A0A9P4LMA0_9PLEO|nr:hypothetical protein EK21DRAFT_69219 [Setomelanomma holmii]
MQQVPTVEEYSEEEHYEMEPSTIASSSAESSDETDHDGAQSSTAGGAQVVQDTPTTSPASTRRSDVEPPEPPRQYQNVKKPLYASSFVHGPGDHDEEDYDDSDEGSDPPQYQAHQPATDVTRTTAAGYELLAHKLSEPPKSSKSLRKGGNLVPMYRKFEHLNHRVLLHLQDEVCELEEELRVLDENIMQSSPRDESGHAFPASRRGDARYGGELHFKRTELLGRIFQKLGQYNQALTSFNSLLKSLDPAGAEDIQAYRAWMEKRAAIDYAETRFLERKNDLVAVSRRPSVSTMRGQHQSPALWLPLGLVLPLLAFAIVPSLLGRIVVIALITAAELRLATTTPEVMSYLTFQEWAMAAAV